MKTRLRRQVFAVEEEQYFTTDSTPTAVAGRVKQKKKHNAANTETQCLSIRFQEFFFLIQLIFIQVDTQVFFFFWPFAVKIDFCLLL